MNETATLCRSDRLDAVKIGTARLERKFRFMKATILVLVILGFSKLPGFSHVVTQSYLQLHLVGKSEVHLVWKIPAAHLDEMILIDSNDDFKITWGEVQAAKERIAQFVNIALRMEASEISAPFSLEKIEIDDIETIVHLSLTLKWKSPNGKALSRIQSDLFKLFDSTHRLVVTHDFGGSAEFFTLNARNPAFQLSAH